MVIPPVSVPVLLYTRSLEISRLCAQPCTRMPPPPCEELVTDRPSMRDGLHWKLLGNGFAPLRPEVQLLAVSRIVPSGIWPSCAMLALFSVSVATPNTL